MPGPLEALRANQELISGMHALVVLSQSPVCAQFILIITSDFTGILLSVVDLAAAIGRGLS
jgi:hypothetical protein